MRVKWSRLPWGPMLLLMLYEAHAQLAKTAWLPYLLIVGNLWLLVKSSLEDSVGRERHSMYRRPWQ